MGYLLPFLRAVPEAWSGRVTAVLAEGDLVTEPADGIFWWERAWELQLESVRGHEDVVSPRGLAGGAGRPPAAAPTPNL